MRPLVPMSHGCWPCTVQWLSMQGPVIGAMQARAALPCAGAGAPLDDQGCRRLRGAPAAHRGAHPGRPHQTVRLLPPQAAPVAIMRPRGGEQCCLHWPWTHRAWLVMPGTTPAQPRSLPALCTPPRRRSSQRLTLQQRISDAIDASRSVTPTVSRTVTPGTDSLRAAAAAAAAASPGSLAGSSPPAGGSLPAGGSPPAAAFKLDAAPPSPLGGSPKAGDDSQQAAAAAAGGGGE